MSIPQTFTEHIALKFRLYGGLFFDLPYEYVNAAGTMLPLFTQYCKDELQRGVRPDTIVTEFFTTRLGMRDFSSIKDHLFAFARLCERQIVLFDAVEDGSFHLTRDLDGQGSLHDTMGKIQAQGLTERFRELFETFKVRVVLTAHPTQFYTEQVLGIISELREAIRTDNVQLVNKLLLQLGRTRFKKKEKPSPYDEAKAIVWFMEHVLYEVVPSVYGSMLKAAGLEIHTSIATLPSIELGFWPGGDRDGNPNVTSDTTKKVGELLFGNITRLYLSDLAELQKRLTFDGIIEKLQHIRQKLEQTSILANCSFDGDEDYQRPEDLIADLIDVRLELEARHSSLFVEELDEFLLRIRTFGFHFGSLDLRQDSRVLAKTVNEVVTILEQDSSNYLDKDQDDRMDFLSHRNEAFYTGKIQTVLTNLLDPVMRDSLEVFIAAKTIQDRNGQHSVHRFIVSNTQGPSDIMGLRLLALVAGFEPNNMPFDFVPLFETVNDLANADESMSKLWEHPVYRAHVSHRGDTQHIMLGFSDGTKDGGYLSANWGIYRAKQNLSKLARAHGIKVVFFDGRGGPPARGGGNTHKFYRSLGRDIEGRNIHMTVQGQTISSTYGHKNSARYNLEQLLSAVIDNTLYPYNEDWHLNDREASIIDELSVIAHKHYTELRDNPQFLSYIEEFSPLRYYSNANNSSRPARRPGSEKLKLDDLRAIPFVGAWSQLKQNIPGYYGLGKALATLDKAGRFEELASVYQGSLYFRTIIENSMQSLSKVYLPLTAWIIHDKKFSDFHGLIVEEVTRTIEMLLKISGQEALLAHDGLTRASIRMREDLIVPMSVIQQYALQHMSRIQKKGEATNAEPGVDDLGILEKLIVKTMATCVNASRNSV